MKRKTFSFRGAKWLCCRQSLTWFRSSRPEVFCKKVVLRSFTKFTGKHLCQSLFFNKVKKETLAQMFSCEFCEISKNTFYSYKWLNISDMPTIYGQYEYGQTPLPIDFKVTNQN